MIRATSVASRARNPAWSSPAIALPSASTALTMQQSGNADTLCRKGQGSHALCVLHALTSKACHNVDKTLVFLDLIAVSAADQHLPMHAAGALHACLHGPHRSCFLFCTTVEGRRKWWKGSPSHPGAMCSCSACASRVTRRSSANSRIVTTLAMRRKRNLRGFCMHDFNQYLKF